MDQQTRIRLLQSIDAGRLVILCGAGLSMAPPSSVPSANDLAQLCFNRYTATIDPDLDPDLENDLEAIAGYFFENGTLIRYFIRRLVPWDVFLGTPNRGHNALADFLISRIADAVLSSNYDPHIENAARSYGEDFQVAMDGDEAIVYKEYYSPLIKFHGCMYENRDRTVWVQEQLTTDVEVSRRIENITTWMEAHLRERDLLIIGYWSDWAYLNHIIESAFNNVTPNSVFLIDTAETVTLEEKAPVLWQKAHADGVYFEHIQQSGSDFLEELRIEFSKMYIRKLLGFGKELIEADIGVEAPADLFDQPEMSGEELYQWRRDAEGITANEAARKKEPDENEILGFFHLLLRHNGAEIKENGYLLEDKMIKVVNGSGHHLSTMRDKFIEPPSCADIDFILCVGSVESGLPNNFIPRGEKGHIIESDSLSTFLNHSNAREVLNI